VFERIRHLKESCIVGQRYRSIPFGIMEVE
jgi:hypothetical protein